jgi:multiple sugar transport system ATP-binding protein
MIATCVKSETRRSGDVSEIRLEGVGKVYAGDVRAVDDVSLAIGSGEFMVLVGPSGCGKSTLLRMVAGLEEVTDGEIWIGEREVSRLAPRDRDVAMVFQNYALYPHLSVAKNLGYGLKVRKTPKRVIEQRVTEVARLLGLEELLDRRPGALSGGQRQRVAMGRAIVREPAAFLMDEPLSNLDAKLRVDMRGELARLHDRLAITTVYVTHDQVEAMTLGTRVAVMRDGTVQQVDTPQRLYREPVNLFVAAFIGSPSMNFVEAQVGDDTIEFAGFQVPLSPSRRPQSSGGRRVILGIRPQDFDDARTAQDDGQPTIDVEAAVVEELGSATHVLFTIDAPAVDVDSVRAATDEGERATLLATDRRALFTAELPEGTTVRPGDRLRLALDHTRLHFFDPATGDSLRAGALAGTAT